MKFFRNIFLLLAGLLFKHGLSDAQDMKAMNDSLFQEVKKQVNAQNGDGLYALLNTDFQAKFTKDAFAGVLKNSLYPMGAIRETSFLTYKDGASNYKAVCVNAVLQFRIVTDKAGKISGLRFTLFKEPVASKNYSVPTDNAMQTQLDKEVDTVARQYIGKINTVGLIIGILKNGTTTIYGYGTTVKDKATLPGANAIFEIGSITKTFTAILLAYYVEEHKVSLSDPIIRYLPDSVAANKDLGQITLLMLANHTSGLPRLPDNLFDNNTNMMNPYKNYNKEKLYSYLKVCKTENTPGEKYAYSNLAAGLLADILERISGQAYEQMVTNIICKPLHMDNSCQHPNAQQKELQVSVYNDKGEPVIMWDMDALAGAGALRSTMHDMLLYAGANMKKDKTGLSEALELTHHITYSKEMSVGLGWHKMQIAGMDCYWHNGGTGGSSSYIAFVPDKNIAVVVLSNAAERVDETAEGIIKVLK